MELLSHILKEAKCDDLKEILSRDTKLQVIDLHGISQVHSQTQSECLNLTLWDGFDEIQAKVVTDILNRMTQTIELYCILSFNSCCFLKHKSNNEKILMVGSDIKIIKKCSEKILPQAEVSLVKEDPDASAIKVLANVGEFFIDPTPCKECETEIDFSDLEEDSDSHDYLPISKISICHNYQRKDWKIKAKVVNIFPIKRFKSRFDNRICNVLNIILADYYTGEEIEGTFYDHLIEKFFNVEEGEVKASKNPDHIVVNQVYIISGCKILDNKNTSTVDHKRKLNFKEDSLVKRWFPVNRKALRKLKKANFVYNCQLVSKVAQTADVIGVVSNKINIFHKTSSKSLNSIVAFYLLIFKNSKQEHLERVILKICDNKASILDFQQGDIIAIFNCKVKKASMVYLESHSIEDILMHENLNNFELKEQLGIAYESFQVNLVLDEISNQVDHPPTGEDFKTNEPTVKCQVIIPSENYDKDHLLFIQKCMSCGNYQDILEGDFIHKTEYCNSCNTDREFCLEYNIQCQIVLESGTTYQCVMRNLCALEILPRPAYRLYRMEDTLRKELLDTCTKCFCEMDDFYEPDCKHDNFCNVILEDSWAIQLAGSQQSQLCFHEQEGKTCYEIFQILFLK
ncbi:unnamed protein product [Moneuplotes crassus]|uniref:Uncharacterized protein n=1 Tax=Euplotes crassus TaxID=5936 RepID=A0AAD1U290_EUPCR|nr:unnamed protein product [Moneuplotes crassus]